MAGVCEFTGSYYEPSPWTDRPCAVDYSVPEGCPMHFVTGASIDPANVMAYRISANQELTPTASTATIEGSDVAKLWVMDVASCDCEYTTVEVAFSHVAVDVPAAVAGERVQLFGGFGDYEVAITEAGPCPTPQWPTGYWASLACDRCPEDPIDPTDPDGSSTGCSAGGEPSALLVAAILALVRRRLGR